MEMTEEIISEFKDRTIGMTKSAQRELTESRSEESQDLWGCNNIFN